MRWFFVFGMTILTALPALAIGFRDVRMVIHEAQLQSSGLSKRSGEIIAWNVLAMLLTCVFAFVGACSAQNAELESKLSQEKLDNTIADMRAGRDLIEEVVRLVNVAHTASTKGEPLEPTLNRLQKKSSELSEKFAADIASADVGRDRAKVSLTAGDRVRVTSGTLACYRDQRQANNPVCYVPEGSSGKVIEMSHSKHMCHVSWDDAKFEVSWVPAAELSTEISNHHR